jgi:hypothetical protein
VRYNDIVVFEAKQLNRGATALKLKISAADAKTAGIPVCLLKAEGLSKGYFERSVFAEDTSKKPIPLVNKVNKLATTVRSEEVLRSVAKLFFEVKHDAKNEAKKAALERFSLKFTKAKAPVK